MDTATLPLWVVILGIIAFAVSEILPFIKSKKANGILQGIVSVLGAVLGALGGKKK
jgi:hypothetical protein